jgi:malate dehydrogenase
VRTDEEIDTAAVEYRVMALAAIIGAGPLGSAVAHRLARTGRFRQIRLIDERVTIASGKALDIQQAGPVEGFDTRLDATVDLTGAAAAGIVVVADSVGPTPTEWQGEPGLAMLARVSRTATRAIVLFAGASPLWLMERASAELDIAAGRLLGSAPLALRAAANTMVALEAGTSALDVDVPIVGLPPDRLVFLWDQALVAGAPARRRLTQDAFSRVESRLLHLWPPGPFSLASAAVTVATAIADGSRRHLICLTVRKSTHGSTRAVALPVRLGPEGVRDVVFPDLAGRDRALLEAALGETIGT